jgi:outer membrane protein TolC
MRSGRAPDVRAQSRAASAVAAALVALAMGRPAPSLADQPPAPTAPPKVMTVEQAADFALTHNVNVIKAQAAVASAGATLAGARAATLPTVGGQLQSQLDKQTNSAQFAQIGASVSPTFSQNTAAITGNFVGLNLVNIYQARADAQAYDQAMASLRLAREQSTLDVETAYYKYVELVEITEVARENAAYNKALVTIAEVNFRAGKVSGVDQLKAQVEYTRALEQLSSAQADAVDAREDLAQLIGASMFQEFYVPAVVPEPPLPDLDTKLLNELALANRPEISIADAELNSAFISYAAVDAPNRPNVSVAGAWGNQASPTNNAANFNACVGAGFPPSQCGPGPSHFYEISIVSAWQLPLLDWGTVHAGHGSARKSIDLQLAQVASAKQQALIDVDQAVRRLLVNRENLRLATTNASVAKQAADISVVQYKVGVISQTDVTVAQQSYLTAARDLLTAQSDYVLSIVRLKMATGTLTGPI